MAKHVVNSDLQVKGGLILSGNRKVFVKGDGSLDSREFIENETLTKIESPTISGNILTISYVGEDNLRQQKDVDLSPLIKRQSMLSSATYDASKNIITLKVTDNDPATEDIVYDIDLSEFQVLITTNGDGKIELKQEGVIKYTFAKVAGTGAWADISGTPTTLSGYGITDVYTKSQTYNQSEIEILNNDVKQYSSDLFDSLTVGGRNLFVNSTFSNGGDYWSLAGVNARAEYRSAERDVRITTSDGGGIWRGIDLKNYSGPLTVSFEMQPVYMEGLDFIFGLEGFGPGLKVVKLNNDNKKWVKFSHTFNVQDRGWIIFIFYYQGAGSKDAIFKNFKLEKGNKASDWTPAPEDIIRDANLYSSNLVSNIKIGGRNLLRNTRTFKGWNGLPGIDGGYGGLKMTKAVGSWNYASQDYTFESGQQYTISAFVKTNSPMLVGCYFFNGGPMGPMTTKGGVWERYSYTFVSDGSKFPVRLESGGASNDNPLFVSGIKLEKGNMTTDWTPSPDDIYDEISDSVSSFKAKSYSQLFGNDKDTEFTITHNLDADVVYTVINMTTGLVEFCEVQSINNNVIILRFTNPPKQNSYKIIVK